MKEITRKGELSRAEMELLLRKHLEAGLLKLAEEGITISFVAMPTKDPADGKAIISSNTSEPYDLADVFEQAVRELRQDRWFMLAEGKS